jgi:hypothetical protein
MEDYLTHQEFLLSLDFAHEAFVKLLKEHEIFDKEKLIKEIKRLTIEDIRKQIKGQKGYQLYS